MRSRLFRHTPVLAPRLTRCVAALVVVAALVTIEPPAAHAASKAVQASVLSKQAMKFHFSGQYAAAESLFREAYKLDPVPGYLYSAARAAHKGGKTQAAIADYKQIIATAPDTQFALKAQMYLGKLTAQKPKPAPEPAPAAKPAPQAPPAAAKPAPVKAAPAKPAPVKAAPAQPAPVKPAPKPAAKPAPAPSGAPAVVKPVAPKAGGPDHTLAYAGLGLGAAGLITAGVMGAMWSSEKAAHDERVRADGKIVGDEDEVRAEIDSINNKALIAYIAGGVGVAAAGIGAWMLLNADDTGAESTTLVVPTTNGAAFIVRF